MRNSRKKRKCRMEKSGKKNKIMVNGVNNFQSFSDIPTIEEHTVEVIEPMLLLRGTTCK